MIRLFGLSLFLFCFSAECTFAADARNGANLAKIWCSTCHLVDPNQKGATTEATPFASVAARPDFNEAKACLLSARSVPKNAYRSVPKNA